MNLTDLFAGCRPATLEDMLEARERRVERQRILLATHRRPLISFTLNIPGAYKDYPLARDAFAEGAVAIRNQLRRAGLPEAAASEYPGHTGCEGYFSVPAPAADLKRQAMLIENGHPLGRLFDIDVLNENGDCLRGGDAGRVVRECLICGKPVWECARSRAHPAEELSLRTARLIRDYFDAEFADHIASLATRALLYEVNVTPKPGLVDRANTGSHRDMDSFTFIDSSVVLTPYFRDLVRQGIAFPQEPGAMLPWLRYPGQTAEERMFAATGGVNTHKGLIFSMGILCAAAGFLRARRLEWSPESLLGVCGRIAATIPEELERSAAAGSSTHGECVFGRFGLTGIRGEAAAGYPHVLRHGFPALREALARGCSLNDAGVAALLRLMAVVEDTNMVTRSDLATLREEQEELCGFLAREKDSAAILVHAAALDRRFMEKRLSPGGSADLLAIVFFLHFLFADV